MKIIRYTIIFLLIALAVVLLQTCELDPWALAQKTYIKNKNGTIKVINTNQIVVTKTHVQYVKNKKDRLWKSESKPQMAQVIFSHRIHSKEKIDCVYCHHKNKNPERNKICASCHYGYDAYKVIHGTCSKCHSMATSKCSTCHTGKN